jgi:hypothetical protein
MNIPTPAKAFWSIMWRATVLLPFMFAVFLLFCAVWIGLLFLPLHAVLLALDGEWLQAGGVSVAWVLLFLLARMKIWKWLKVEDKDCLNSQENI